MGATTQIRCTLSFRRHNCCSLRKGWPRWGSGSNRDKSQVSSKYRLYGSRMSYFTQKMHAALQWHLPGEYEFIVKDFENGEELESRSGTHQIPVVITPENWCI